MILSNLKRPQLSQQIEKISVPSRPIVALIMSVYDHWEYTRDALNSYFSSRDEAYHYILILIDDCSYDQTQDFLVSETQHRDNIVYLRFKDNGGLTRLWNYGVHYAIHSLHAEYILLANNDVLIPSGALRILVDGLRNTAGPAIIGPLTNCPGYHEKTQDIRIFLPDYRASHAIQDIENTSQRISTNPLRVVDGINGFFWGAHHDVFMNNILWSWGRSVYYFNPFNRDLHNEREFQRRLFRKGGRSVLASNAFIFHYKDVSMKRVEAGQISSKWIYRSV